MTTDAEKDLRAAWDDLIADLQQARDAIDQPELMPPPRSERNLAEGYRYLMGYAHSAIERAFHNDPDRPHFHNALSIHNRATNYIHFQFPDGSELRRAFCYHWRLWTLPEIREVLEEAGFQSVAMYWEGTDDETGEGNGEWFCTANGDADHGWVAYIVGIK